MGEVSPVAVSAAVAFVVAVLVAISVQCEADTRSPAAEPVRGAAATGVAIGAITDSLMMSSSATSAFRAGGAGAIRTDITVTTITRTITMGTVTTVAPGTVTMMAAAMDTAMAADQGICGVCGGGDKRALRRLGFSLLLLSLDTLRNCLEEFAEGLQSAIPALRAVEENPESAVALGFGKENASAVIKALEKEAGVEVKALSAAEAA